MRKQKFLAALLAVVMMFTLVPVMAVSADDSDISTFSSDNDALSLEKNTVLEDDGTYTITLEAYSTGTVTTTTITKDVPLDIVLVLDQSGSMAYNFDGKDTNTNTARRQYAMKNAVNSFIGQVADKYDAETSDHRMALVTFGSNASPLQGWTYVDAAGETTLTNKVSGLPNSPSGATNVAAGMTQAEGLHGDNSYTGANTTRQKVVIVFTDGVPTTSTDFNTTVATNAIKSAKNMKDDGIVVYSIGIFNGVDANQLYGEKWDYTAFSDVTCTGEVGSYWGGSWLSEMVGSNDFDGIDIAAGNRFLNYLSSNFLNTTEIGVERGSYHPEHTAVASGTGYKITKNFDRDADSYYLTATDAESLNKVFTTISTNLDTSSTTTTLGTESVMKDILGDNFVLPEGYTASSSIKVQLQAGTSSNGRINWGETTDAPETIVVDANVETGTVDVVGFDYKEEHISDAHPGHKLIVTISGVELDPEKVVEGTVPTNNPDSGIYTEDGEEGVLVKDFEIPTANLESKTYVIDYAKSFTMNSADWLNEVKHIADNTSKITNSTTTVSLDLNNGKVEGTEGTYIYTPQTTSWNGYDTFFAFGTKDNSNIWSSINVIPANNIYYEDTFVTAENTGVVGIEFSDKWSVGTETNTAENANGAVQGWESVLADDKTYSSGDAHVATEKGATASFTFTGTGVDVYTSTDINSGMVTAKIESTTTGSNFETKYFMVDNLAVSGTYYQVPTLSFNDLPYDEYKVTLAVNRAKAVEKDAEGNVVFDENGNPSYLKDTYRSTYYLDGIRIYNPMGATVTDDVVIDGYIGDNNVAQIETTFKAVNELLTEGAVFTDTVDGEVAVKDYYVSDTYTTYGPKNEVYLAKDQTITFKVEGGSEYYVGMKSLTGADITAEDITAEATYGAEKKVYNIAHSTDLYYEVVPNADGLVTIKNTSDAILSLTKVQAIAITAEGAQAVTVNFMEVGAEEAANYVATFASLNIFEEVEEPEEEKEEVTPEVDVEIENPEVEEKPVVNTALKDMVKNLFSKILGWFTREVRR